MSMKHLSIIKLVKNKQQTSPIPPTSRHPPYPLRPFLTALIRANLSAAAAQSAYYLQLAVLPLLLLLLTFLHDDEALWALFPPGVAAVLQGAVGQAPDAAGLPLAPLVMTLFSASTAMHVLSRGVRAALAVPEPTLIRGRVGAAGLLSLLAALPLAGMLLPQLTAPLVGYIGEFVSVFAFLCLLYGSADAKRRRAIPKLLGVAAVVALCWMALTRGFELYLQLFFRYDVLYGGIGAFFALGLWLYATSCLVLGGAVLYAVTTPA